MSKTWKTSNQMYGSHNSRSQSMSRPKIGRSTQQFLETLDPTNFVHQQQKIAQRQRHGLFTQPLGLSPGDQYMDPAVPKPSKRMQVNKRMIQKVGPQLFSKLGSTNINDPYLDSYKPNQLYIKQKYDMNIHPKQFRAGGKQKLVKNSEYPHYQQYDHKQYNTRDQDGKVVTSKKGIFTSNMKKGYGNTTSGHLFSQYPYNGYPDQDTKNKFINQKLQHKAKIPKSFKSGLPHQPGFAPSHTLYNNSQPYQPKNQDQQFRARSTAPGGWKYNNPGKKGKHGTYGTFTGFPTYIPQGQKIKKPIKQQPIWIPNFNGTSKNYGQTLAKPCTVPSQLILNQIRRN